MAAVGTRLLQITVGGTDYTAQMTKAVITSSESDSDTTTFADAAAGGGRDYALEFEGVQDLIAGTLWDKVFTAPGTTVACLLKPYGNAAASVSQPHFGFNAVVTEPDGDFIGTEADKSVSAKAKFEGEWPLTAKPTRITA